jgi:hypothetical protein
MNRHFLIHICSGIALLAVGVWLQAGCACRLFASARSQSLLDPLQAEIENGLADRGLTDHFDRYQRYTDDRLDASAGTNTWSDKSGGCRLAWYDWMIRHQLQSPVEAERFTRELHAALRSDHHGLVNALDTATEKLDLNPRHAEPPASLQQGQSEPHDAFTKIQYAVAAAHEAYGTALAALTEEEQQELRRELYKVTTQKAEEKALSFVDAAAGRRMCELLRAMNRQALVEAGRALLLIADTALLDTLSQYSATHAKSDNGILIAGPGADNHDLDAMMDVSIVVDYGGDDTYMEGTVSADRPVLVIIDLGGNDIYRGRNPGIQGGAVLGVSMLLDVAGTTHTRRSTSRKVHASVVLDSLLISVGTTPIADYEETRDRQWVALRSMSIAQGTIRITPPCLRRVSADHWGSACWMTYPARIITTQAANGPIRTVIRPGTSVSRRVSARVPVV